MGRIAFVFSGQGDQHPGMGKGLKEAYPAAAEVFERLDGLRPGTSEQCFFGSEEELKETKNTQPCLFAMELAATAVLLERGLEPEAVAGFSLGEVAAAAAAGYFDLETGFRLVCRRGELMQSEAERFDAVMAAVVKLSAETVTALTEAYPDLWPVNFNCPGNVTVSGLAPQMDEFSRRVREAGGRLLPLKVKGAFHSPLMTRAAEGFRRELEAAQIHPGRIRLYSNVTAQPYGEDVPGLLSEQIRSPVQWERLIRNMIAGGIDTFIEIGPGRTLTNMIRKIDPSVTAKTVAEVLEETVC